MILQSGERATDIWAFSRITRSLLFLSYVFFFGGGVSPSGEKKSIGSFSCAPDFGPSAARAPFRVENRVRNREDPQPPNTNTLSFLHPQNTFKNDVTNLLGFFCFFFFLFCRLAK